MNINTKAEGSKLIVELEDRLDTGAALQLEGVLKEKLRGVTDRVMDFKDFTYISSARLRVLLSAMKLMKKQGSLVVRNVNETVMEVFEITGFADMLIQVSNPSSWMVLGAALELVLGLRIWGFFGELTQSVTFSGLVEGGMIRCYVDNATSVQLETGMTVNIVVEISPAEPLLDGMVYSVSAVTETQRPIDLVF